MSTQQVSRAVRLIELMRLLNERRWTVAALAQRFGVSEQTIYRDLRTIQDEPLRYPVITRNMWSHMRLELDC